MMRFLTNSKFFLVIIFVIAFINWFLPAYLNVDKNGTFLITPDPFYHARRVMLTVHNYPNLPVFDYYISFPTGAHCIWPPLFDFLTSTACFVIFGKCATMKQVEWVCAISPIFWGMFVVLLTFLIARRLFDEKLAFVSVLLTTFLPRTYGTTRFGYFDHHIAETFGILLIFYVLISYEHRGIIKWVLLGIAFGISLLLWQGSILFVGITFFILLWKKEFDSFVSFLIALLMILPFSLNTHFPDSPFSYRGLSLLHLSLLTIASLILFAGRIYHKVRHLSMIIFALLIGLSILLIHSKSFISGIFFILKNDPWLATILEFQSLIVQSGYLDNLAVKKTFGLVYYFWPLILLVIFCEKRTHEKFVLFSIFSLITGVMSFIGRRYGIWFVPFYAVMFTYLFKKIINVFGTKLGAAIITIIIAVNLWVMKFDIYITKPNMPNQEEIKACYWIRDSLPATSNLFAPNRKPEYGIMCFWDIGHYIVYLGQRPVTASNFGNDAPNFIRVNEFFLTTSEDEALEILREFSSPYILINAVNRNIYLASKYLGIPPKHFLNLYYTKDNRGKVMTIMEPNASGIRTTNYRLFTYLGSGFYYGNNFYEPYRHFRMRYFSNLIRIFEYVNGVTIRGRTKPNALITINYDIKLPTVNFTYYDSVTAESTGHFSVVVPYSSYPDNKCVITIDNKDIKNLSITEENIVKGDTIFIP